MTAPIPMPALDASQALALLRDWSEQGRLRHLDWALARMLHGLEPAAPPALLIAAALLAQLEGQGHSCLPLDELAADAPGLVGWAEPAAAAWRALQPQLPADAAAWRQLLSASRLVWVDRPPPAPPLEDRNPPLVLRGQRLYLRRYWRCERQVALQVLQRSADLAAPDPASVRPWIARLFPARAPAETAAGPDWQALACAVALRTRLSVITGGPGTGKTYTAARLLALLLAVDPAPQRLRIALAAPTGKAAARLRQSIGSALQELEARLGAPLAEGLPLAALVARIGPARTLHGLLGARPDTRRLKADATHPLDLDLLIVDEASMVHLEMMAALLEALPRQARLVLLGDKDQLASVEAGAVLGDLCRGAEQGRYQPATAAWLAEATGEQLPAAMVHGGPPLAQQTVMLRSSRRYSGAIGQLALAAQAGDAARAQALLRGDSGGALAWLEAGSAAELLDLALHGRAGATGGHAGPGSFLQRLRARPVDAADFPAWTASVLQAFDGFRLLCALREGDWGVGGLNQAIAQALVARGLLNARGEWYEGRPVMVGRNDPGVGVFNGDVGIVLRPPPGPDGAAPLRAYFLDGEALRSVGVSRLPQVDTAFAMTVHKSQGSEFAHTVLVLPREPSRVLGRELVYTGITRARSAFTLVTGRREAFAEALARPTLRSSGLVDGLEGADTA